MRNSNGRIRLPKELQDFKKMIKELTFKERVKAYFDCSPFTSDTDKYKKEIIFKGFSKEEREEFYRIYLPIYNSIDRYGDRMRAINANRIIYSNYITTALRNRDTFSYTADMLNLIFPEVARALEDTKEENTRKRLTEALRLLKRYRVNNIKATNIKYDEKKGTFVVPIVEEDNFLMETIKTLKGILSLLKCYLEALQEFLEWVGYPELLPREFYDMETDLLSEYRPLPRNTHKSPDADRLPLFFAENEVKEEYLSIDYKALPRTIDIFKDKNIFAETYRRFFNF
jgi:hypothetical protein